MKRLKPGSERTQVNEVFFGGDEGRGSGIGPDFQQAIQINLRIMMMVWKRWCGGQVHFQIAKLTEELLRTGKTTESHKLAGGALIDFEHAAYSPEVLRKSHAAAREFKIESLGDFSLKGLVQKVSVHRVDWDEQAG